MGEATETEALFDARPSPGRLFGVDIEKIARAIRIGVAVFAFGGIVAAFITPQCAGRGIKRR
jgi:hypothetical protein